MGCCSSLQRGEVNNPITYDENSIIISPIRPPQVLERRCTFNKRKKTSREVTIKSKKKIGEVKCLEFTPDRNLQSRFRYSCPICLRFFTDMLKAECCKNYTCFECAKDLSSGNLNFNIKCPHCNHVPLLLTDVDPTDSIKQYSDSPTKICSKRLDFDNNNAYQSTFLRDPKSPQNTPYNKMAESTPLTSEQIEQFSSAMVAFYDQSDDSRLSELFQLFDRDGNGTISSNELKTVMSSVSGERVSDAEVTEMIQEADTNGDGVIQLGEFIQVMKKHRDN